MWAVLCLTIVVFVFFGLKVEYEENISKLLPTQDSASESELAFSNLKVKDKIFVQIRAAQGCELDQWTLASYMDEFVDSLYAKDEATGYIGGILSRIDDDVMLNALDYALNNVPSLVDTSCYPVFDSMLTKEAIAARMADNARIVWEDMTGSASTMVGYDPAGLREAMLAGFLGQTSEDGSQDGQTEGDGAAAGDGLAGVAALSGGYSLVDGQIFCPDGTVALAFVSPNFNSFDSKSGAKLVKLIEKNIDEFSASHEDAQVLFHGSPVQSVFNARQIKKDLASTMSVSVILICLLICICFRDKYTLFYLLFPVLYGAFFALACVWLIKGGMSLLVLGLGALILGVAMSYCLHVLTHYKYVGDPVRVLKDQSTPVILGCVTTIGAFAGLLFTQSSLLQDFGIFASIAMVGTTLAALIFLPQFFRPEHNRRNEKAFDTIERIVDYPFDRQKWLLVLIVLICVVCCFTQSRVKFDSDLRHIGYYEPKIMESQALYAEKNNGGLASMYYGVAAPTLDEALTYNKAVTAVIDSLKNAGTVKQYSGIVSLFTTDAEARTRIDAWKAYWSPERVASVRSNVTSAARAEGLNPAMFETFYTMVEADYEPQSLYDAGVLPDELLCNYIEETYDGRFMVFTSTLMPEDQKMTVNDAVAACPGAVVIDPFYYTNDMVRVLNDDFNLILNVSVLFVFVILLISFRSIVLAIIAFLPMGLSWFVVKGVMGIFGIEFNLINIIISTFIFGIGVDYSIFVMKGLLARASGQDDNLLKYHKTAIFFSAFALIVVVLSLLFAVHPAIKSIGVSTLIGMASTILITFTLQPFIFRQMMKISYFSRRFGPKDKE